MTTDMNMKTTACCDVCKKDNVWTIADCLCNECFRRTCDTCTPETLRCDYCFRLNCDCSGATCTCFKPTESDRERCVLCAETFLPQYPLYHDCPFCEQHVCHNCITKNPYFTLPRACSHCDNGRLSQETVNMGQNELRLYRAKATYISEDDSRSEAVVQSGKLTRDIVAHLLTTIPALHWSTSHCMEDRVIDWFISCINKNLYSFDEIKDIASLLGDMKEARDDYRAYS